MRQAPQSVHVDNQTSFPIAAGRDAGSTALRRRVFASTILVVAPTRPSFVEAARQSMSAVAHSAGFAENWSAIHNATDPSGEDAFLFEAAPEPFSTLYPSLVSGYEPDQPPPCIDLWLYRSAQTGHLRVSLEGVDVQAWLRRHGRPELADAIAGSPRDLSAALTAAAKGIELILADARVS